MEIKGPSATLLEKGIGDIGNGEQQGRIGILYTDHPSTIVNHGIGGHHRPDRGEANCHMMGNEGCTSIALAAADGEWVEIDEAEEMGKKAIYVCVGSCHGVASEEEWRKGAKNCSAKGCSMHGKPLKRKVV